nr:exosome complex component RRP42-like [Tanacetum cinerariifolium]
MVGLSIGEKHFIQGGIAQDLRTDGRKRFTYRPIVVESGVIAQANGSARVKMGRTEVIASVKAELGRPSSSAPDKGKVSIYIDCSPTAAPEFERRGGEALSMELSAALRQCLLGGKTVAGSGIDLSSLSIVDGRICWDLYIDGLVISMDGNVLDALGAAIKAALSNTGIPKVNVASAATSSDEQPEVDVSDEEFLQFDTTAVPVIVTLTKVGRHYIVDATLEEESQMSSAVSVSINRQGLICGLTKRGGANLDPRVILDMIPVAKHFGAGRGQNDILMYLVIHDADSYLNTTIICALLVLGEVTIMVKSKRACRAAIVGHDYMATKQYAIKAQALCPQLEGVSYVSGLFLSANLCASSCAVVVPVCNFLCAAAFLVLLHCVCCCNS